MRDLSVRYGSVAAVRGVSFDVEPGTTRALVGPNGAGKTSALAAAAGIVASTGSVMLGDIRLDGTAPERRARAGLAYVPGGRRLFGRLSVEQNLFVGSVRVRGRREARDAVARTFDAFPILAERAHQRAETLSGGEGQLVMIARALVAQPRVLLVDEPFEGLSADATQLVVDALRLAAEGGAAVLVASPDPVYGFDTVAIGHGTLREAEVVR